MFVNSVREQLVTCNEIKLFHYKMNVSVINYRERVCNLITVTYENVNDYKRVGYYI